MDTRHPPRTLELRIGQHRSGLWMRAPGAGAPDLELPLGWGNVRPGPFLASPPSAREIEAAIAHVEDHVMPLARVIPAGLRVRVAVEGLDARVPLPGTTLDDVEAAFTQLAAIAQGRPVGTHAACVEPAAAAALVIVRELMHHTGMRALATR